MRGILFRLSSFVFVVLLSCTCFAKSEIFTDRTEGKELLAPDPEVSFPFVILGDRTTGNPDGLGILRQAVEEINLLRPDFVITIGDMVQGYNDKESWDREAKEYLEVMENLEVPWYPTAGNHDICWRGEGRPENEHEGDYETVFGPAWYAMKHKDCWFIVLFTDEGDPETGFRTFDKPSAQMFSPRQTEWLGKMLKKAKGARQVFVFQHHPRWRGGAYGDDWQRIHKMLVEAGNVQAVFAGHDHIMRYYGKRDGIEYYTIGVTGGMIPDEAQKVGQKHHYFQVTVRGDSYSLAAISVGNVSDPKDMQVHTLLEKTSWAIDSPDRRTLEYPIKAENIGGPGYLLLVGVGHGYDDSGDEGIWASVIGPNQKVLTRKLCKSEGVQWLYCTALESIPYRIVLEDQDTEFTGQYPGNGGTIEVYAKSLKENQ